jgi:hypothetical protein
VAAATALAVLALLPPRGGRGAAPAASPPHATGVKGAGAPLIELVRERDGAVTHAPTGFKAGDRFKAMVTCSAPGEVAASIVAVQGRVATTAIPARSIACGNRTVLPGAFRLTGDDPAIVCVVLDDALRPERTPVDALDADSPACARLLHEP